jgi:hypothetical protein
MCTGLVGSVLTALAMAADWYIWDFRYRIFRRPELAPPADGRRIVDVPSSYPRELVVNRAPQSLDRVIPQVHQVEGEWLDLWGQS